MSEPARLFGPVSERELDIAEWVFLMTVDIFALMGSHGIPADLIRVAIKDGDDQRDRLREKLESA